MTDHTTAHALIPHIHHLTTTVEAAGMSISVKARVLHHRTRGRNPFGEIEIADYTVSVDGHPVPGADITRVYGTAANGETASVYDIAAAALAEKVKAEVRDRKP